MSSSLWSCCPYQSLINKIKDKERYDTAGIKGMFVFLTVVVLYQEGNKIKNVKYR